MDGDLGLLVGLVEPDGLGQFALRADRAGVALLVHPLDREGVSPGESTDLPHLRRQRLERDRRINVGDEHLPENE